MIGFQSGGRLITDWAGRAGRHTVARVYVMREEQKNLTGHTSTGQPTAAGGLLIVAPQEESSRETREELRMGGTAMVAAAAAAGGQGGTPGAGARAYDIKHYNYYLNSSRMAPGVAASSSSSLLPSPSLLLHRSSVFPLASSPSLPSPPP